MNFQSKLQIMRVAPHFLFLIFFTTSFFISVHAQHSSENIVSRKIIGNEQHFYPITLKKKSHVDLVITQTNVHLTIHLIDPANKEAKTFYPSDDNRPDTFSFVTPSKGEYIIRVQKTPTKINLASIANARVTEASAYAINAIIVMSNKEYRKKVAEEQYFANWLNGDGGTDCGFCWPGRIYQPKSANDIVGLFFTR
jgi:hypothetical protein